MLSASRREVGRLHLVLPTKSKLWLLLVTSESQFSSLQMPYKPLNHNRWFKRNTLLHQEFLSGVF